MRASANIVRRFTAAALCVALIAAALGVGPGGGGAPPEVTRSAAPVVRSDSGVHHGGVEFAPGAPSRSDWIEDDLDDDSDHDPVASQREGHHGAVGPSRHAQYCSDPFARAGVARAPFAVPSRARLFRLHRLRIAQDDDSSAEPS